MGRSVTLVAKFTIHSPFVDEGAIRERCKQVASQFESGKRKLFNPMINEVGREAAEEKKGAAYRDII